MIHRRRLLHWFRNLIKHCLSLICYLFLLSSLICFHNTHKEVSREWQSAYYFKHDCLKSKKGLFLRLDILLKQSASWFSEKDNPCIHLKPLCGSIDVISITDVGYLTHFLSPFSYSFKASQVGLNPPRVQKQASVPHHFSYTYNCDIEIKEKNRFYVITE